MQEWNFSIQRQITASTSLDIAYVGNKTTHLNQNLSINDPVPGPGAVQARRPYPQWGTITYADFNENANYNSLQVKYETRAWHGLNTLVSYAWSKCIDAGTEQSGPTLLLLSSYRGVCDYDLPQAFAGSFDYMIPVGRGMKFLGNANRFVNAVLGGWEMTGILTLRSGLPFSPVISSDTANTGVSSQPAQVVSTPVITGVPTCWFYVASNSACQSLFPNEAAAFAVPTKYSYGDAGRNILRADGLKQLDFTMLKGFTLTERLRMQFRAEMFNILNHPTFSAPTATINTSSGGQVTSTLNAGRIIQLAVKLFF